MLTAIRTSDKKRVIGFTIEKDKNETYHCDYCNKEVIHHKSLSQVKIGHFKHKSHSYCANNQSESEDHIKTKKDIKDYLEDTYPKLKFELEKWICNKSIRPDIYIETTKGKKIAIEIQASQLTIDQIINRTSKYYENGIYVLWVLVWKNSKVSNSDYINNQCMFYPCETRLCDHSIKLTEMEVFLHWMNLKKIIYWDYEHIHGDGFYVIDLDKFVSEGTEFYSSGGEYQSFDGRVAKNKKMIVDASFCIDFNEFSPQFISEYKVPGKNYSVPKRTQMKV